MLGHFTRYCKSKRCVLHRKVKKESYSLFSSVLEQTLYASNIKAIVTNIHFTFSCFTAYLYIFSLLIFGVNMQGNTREKFFLGNM